MLGLSTARPKAIKLLRLNNKIRNEYGGSRACPHDGFVCVRAKLFPTGNPTDNSNLEKDQRSRPKAADHPLAVLLNFPLQYESQGNARRDHPEPSLEHGFNREGRRISLALIKMLDVG